MRSGALRGCAPRPPVAAARSAGALLVLLAGMAALQRAAGMRDSIDLDGVLQGSFEAEGVLEGVQESEGPTTLTVQVTRGSSKENWGFSIARILDGATDIMIGMVDKDGIIYRWNMLLDSQNPGTTNIVMPGDFITQVNGVTGNARAIDDEIRKATKMTMTLKRYGIPQDGGDLVRWKVCPRNIDVSGTSTTGQEGVLGVYVKTDYQTHGMRPVYMSSRLPTGGYQYIYYWGGQWNSWIIGTGLGPDPRSRNYRISTRRQPYSVPFCPNEVSPRQWMELGRVDWQASGIHVTPQVTTTAPAPEVTTRLNTAAKKDAFILSASSAGFRAGDRVQISGGGKSETRKIFSIHHNTITLTGGLQSSFPPGAVVTKERLAQPAASAVKSHDQRSQTTPVMPEDCPYTILMSGSQEVHLMGYYVRTTTSQHSRPVYLHLSGNPVYLFFWRETGDWRIGLDNRLPTAGIKSDDDVKSTDSPAPICPHDVLPWAEQVTTSRFRGEDEPFEADYHIVARPQGCPSIIMVSGSSDQASMMGTFHKTTQFTTQGLRDGTQVMRPIYIQGNSGVPQTSAGQRTLYYNSDQNRWIISEQGAEENWIASEETHKLVPICPHECAEKTWWEFTISYGIRRSGVRQSLKVESKEARDDRLVAAAKQSPLHLRYHDFQEPTGSSAAHRHDHKQPIKTHTSTNSKGDQAAAAPRTYVATKLEDCPDTVDVQGTTGVDGSYTRIAQMYRDRPVYEAKTSDGVFHIIYSATYDAWVIRKEGDKEFRVRSRRGEDLPYCPTDVKVWTEDASGVGTPNAIRVVPKGVQGLDHLGDTTPLTDAGYTLDQIREADEHGCKDWNAVCDWLWDNHQQTTDLWSKVKQVKDMGCKAGVALKVFYDNPDKDIQGAIAQILAESS